MKTKDFINKIRDMDYRVNMSNINSTDDIGIFVRGNLVAHVSPTRRYIVSVYRDDTPAKLFNLITTYVSTPVEERGDVKRWYLVLAIPALDNSGSAYLSQNRKTNAIMLSSSNIEDSTWKTIFTEADLKDIDETGFKRVPVEPEEE